MFTPEQSAGSAHRHQLTPAAADPGIDVAYRDVIKGIKKNLAVTIEGADAFGPPFLCPVSQQPSSSEEDQ